MPSPTIRTVQAGPVSIAIADCGQGPPILFVHGFALDHTMWDAQLAALSGRWRTIAVDLRGAGGSEVTVGTVTMEQMADDLAAFLDALAITEPIVYCGLSMGGYVAFQFLRKYPHRLRGLVLCDTRAVADTSEEAAARLTLADQVAHHEDMTAAADALMPRIFAAATIERHPKLVHAMREVMLAAPCEGIAAAARGMAQRPDVRPELSGIRVATLVMVGQEDIISPPDEMRALAAAIPGSEFVVIPNAGHMSPLENPGAFNAALERFLDRVGRKG